MSPELPAALGAATQAVQRALSDAGVAAAAREARLLIAAAADVPTADIIARPERRLSSGQLEQVAELLRRRCGREPLSRILGWREFYGRRFQLSPATLDPRPASETLIEAALAIARNEGWAERPMRILDVGTGTGCLLLTLLAELPQASGLGTDVSDEALAMAARNAAALGLAGRAAFARHDALAGIDERFHLVVSNPPYIASGEIAGLDPEVRDFDPHAALDGGPEGLDIYERIINDLQRVMRGWALFEVGAGQAGAVTQLLQQVDPTGVVTRYCDLAGHERCVAFGHQI